MALTLLNHQQHNRVHRLPFVCGMDMRVGGRQVEYLYPTSSDFQVDSTAAACKMEGSKNSHTFKPISQGPQHIRHNVVNIRPIALKI